MTNYDECPRCGTEVQTDDSGMVQPGADVTCGECGLVGVVEYDDLDGTVWVQWEDSK